MASYWNRVVPMLERAGHAAIAVDLPGDDEQAGLSVYADLVAAAARDASDIILVAQSLGGFTAPLVCDRLPVRRLIFVNAMIPLPGETPGEWGKATGSAEARKDAARRGRWSEEFDDATYFFHDVPPEALEGEDRGEAEAIFGEPCRFEAWPAIPIHVIAGRDDRLFPAGFQRRVARERLGVEADVLPGGHLIALARPAELVEQLLGYLKAAPGGPSPTREP